MKKFFWLFSFTLIISTSYAQYGPEWITYGQEYYKISTTQKGVHRLTNVQLQTAGFPVSVNPKNYRLYFRGVEQAISIQGEADNSFDAGDYLEFYGEGNDGTRDANLYTVPSYQVNPKYNLFSDTTAYFLTYTLGTNGKRMSNSSLSPSAPVETYHFQEETVVFAEQYYLGQNYQVGSNNQVYLSFYDTGEGWAGAGKGSGQFRDAVFTLNNGVSNGVNATVEIGLVGSANGVSNVSVLVGNSTSSLNNLISTNISFSSSIVVKQSFSFVGFTSQMVVRASTNAGSVGVAYVKIRYPQSTNQNSTNTKYLVTRATGVGGSSFLQILNTPSNPILLDITDRNNISRLSGTLSGTQLDVVVPNTSSEHQLYLYASNSIITPSKIEKVSFQNINFSNYNYLIVSHRGLRKPAGGASDIVQEYGNYRASAAGGSYKVLVMNVEDIYNQFNYGEKSPLAIRNFVRYMNQSSASKYLFLIGKALSFPDQYSTLNFRQSSVDDANNPLPTYGFPPSDVCYSSGLSADYPMMPTISTSRLSAGKPVEVLNYLNKVKEHETRGSAVWQKNIVQLSGGKTLDEQNIYKAYIDFFKTIAAGDYLRAIVTNYSKQTTNTVELINISAETNNGLGAITFFGHSTKDITDVEIGFCSDDLQGYRNKGKYPIVIANGCQLASIFYEQSTLSEDWMNTADRGSIGFLAHSYVGYTAPLRRYTTYFYQTAFSDINYIGKSMGSIQQQVLRGYAFNVDDIERAHTQQMILQGDPAVSISPIAKPDYAIANTGLSLETFDKSTLTSITDSFKLKMIVSNAGISDAAKKNIKVQVNRIFADGTIKPYYNNVGYAPVNYQDTLTFVIRKEKDVNGFGLNQFVVTIDYLNEIDEITKTNNQATLEYQMPGIAVVPLLPQEYGIISEQPVTLLALASNLSNTTNEFIIELDTTNQYNSAAKKSITLPAGTIATWSVNLLNDNLGDSVVYYWRTNYLNATTDPNNLWGESSFTYIKNSNDGWSQKHPAQFNKASLSLVSQNPPNSKKWEFNSTNNNIKVTTTGNTYPGGDYTKDVTMTFNDVPLVFGGRCNNDAIICIAFRKSNGVPYLVSITNRCGREPEVANTYNNTEIQSGAIANYLDQIPAGDNVLLFTTGNVQFNNWTTAMKNKLGDIGANTSGIGPTSTLQNGTPYIIFGTKGASLGSATEIVSSNIVNPTAQKISLNTNISFKASEGSIISSRIGPASSWKQLQFDIRKYPNDSYQLDLIGVNLQGTETTLLSNITNPNLSINNIDSRAYPYLKYKLTLNDNVTFTPPQLQKWLALYDGVPEGFVNIDAVGRDKYVIPDKQEGESFSVDFVFQGLTSLSFTDSLTVEYTFTNLTKGQSTVKNVKIKAPNGKETVRFNLTVNTKGMVGDNSLKVFVNPRILPELSYDNNFYQFNFKVTKDNANPLLEVTFDGRQILDGEIVSPSPLISIRLKDNNPFLNQTDTSAMSIALKRPCATCTYENISFNSSEVKWSSTTGVTQIEYSPKSLVNGVYTLRIQGQDASGNRSGVNPYQVNFEVVNESTVTNFFPYPNPFSTSTRFVFTLTGREVPNHIKIQIMTISGKVVREITQNELGNVRIGNNISEYAWDGHDEFGDKLANGVYLYRVFMEGSEAIQHRSTSADKGFNYGFGKLYILR